MSGTASDDPGTFDRATGLSPTASTARDLIRFDTTNFGGGKSRGETEAAHYLGARLEALGLVPQYFDAAPGRTSVVAQVPGADPTRPGLVLHGHTDVVPADPAQWTVDPFAGEVRDGMLWGRGAVDMKDMDAMMIVALERILGAGELPARPVTVAYFADEENGGVFGSHWLVKNHPELFAGASEAISEVGGYSVHIGGQRAYLLQTGEKALVWIRLVATGTAAHGSRLVGDTAIVRLADAVATLARQPWPIQLTATTRRLVDDVAALLGADVDELGPHEVLVRSGHAAGFLTATIRTTSNPTVLSAGYKHNVIPERAEALVDIRTLPGQEDAVLAEVAALLPEGVEIEIVHRDIGLETEFSGSLVDAMVGALHRFDPGAPVLPYLLSGGTDNKALSLLGITGYGFAPLKLPTELNFPAMFHGVDERVPLDALDFGTDVLEELLRTG